MTDVPRQWSALKSWFDCPRLIHQAHVQAILEAPAPQGSAGKECGRTDFDTVMKEYFELGHAEVVHHIDFKESPDQEFYLLMHEVRKDSSVTAKLRIVFDASAKLSTGVSLNDTLMVGLTVKPLLIDVLLHF